MCISIQRLQEQVNDVIDLHQNAVGELRGQLAQVETMTVGKTQDLEDLVEDYQGKVGVAYHLVGVVSQVGVVCYIVGVVYSHCVCH